MSILTRYLIRQNLFLLGVIILISIGIYLLADFFERLDIFLDYNTSVSLIALYFAIKIPLIISQILPATFLVAIIIQLNLMEKNKEKTALAAGGISPLVLVRFIVIYSLLWSTAQLVFAEYIGVEGDRRAGYIWSQEIRGRALQEKGIGTTWFLDHNRIIHVGNALPDKKTGEGLRVYVLDEKDFRISEIILAQTFDINKNDWTLHNVTRVFTDSVSFEDSVSDVFPIKQNLQAFLIAGAQGKPEQLPLWDLRIKIKALKLAGSNVEALLTIWHAKIAYAASIIVMGLAGLVISQLTPNIYKALGFSVIFIFLFYSLNIASKAVASAGGINAFVGAWLPNISVASLCLLWFFRTTFRRA